MDDYSLLCIYIYIDKLVRYKFKTTSANKYFANKDLASTSLFVPFALALKRVFA